MSLTYPPCVVYYLPPEIDASAKLVNEFASGARQFQEQRVDLASVDGSLRSLFHRYIDEVASGTLPDPVNYKWNIFKEIGVPDFSMLAVPSRAGRKPPHGAIDFSTGLHTIFQSFNTDSKIANAFVNQSEGGIFQFTKGHPLQQEFIIAITEPEGIYSLTKSQPEGYKIHLTPKADYAVFTLLRFFTILKENKVFHSKNIHAKITFHFRDNRPREENTELAKLNGGGVPTIVLYASHNNETTKGVLESLLAGYKDHVSTLGSMTPDYKYRILPFNVRLNSLIAYAQGDRSAKLNNRNQFAGFASMRVEAYIHLKKYFMPNWVSDMIVQANEERVNQKTKRTLSTLSLQLLGKDICSPELQTELYDPRCLDDICWMTGVPKSMLDPRTLVGLELEQASAGSEEADTSANNAVEEDPTNPSNSGPIGAGAGAGVSGGYRKKYRTTKKQKKPKKRRGVSRRGRRS